MAQLTNEQYLERIQTGLIKELTKNKGALPPGFNQERFTLNCIAVIRDMMMDKKKREKLAEVKMETIPICLAEGAYLGLDFFNGECYAVPYGGIMQFQTDYKGEIKLCKRYSSNPIKDIFAKVVREGDFFEEIIDEGKQNIRFKPVPFSDHEMIGAFAIVVYKDGSMVYDTMSKQDIENTRQNYSKSKDSPAWRNSPGEMYKKTVLRRLCKLVDLDFDNIEQRRAYEDGGDSEFVDMLPDSDQEDKVTNVFDAGQAQKALPEPKETISGITGQRRKQKAEPVKEEAPDQGAYAKEYAEFEEGYSDFDIPDEADEGLPFR